MKRKTSMHIVVTPKLATPLWLRQLNKAANVIFFCACDIELPFLAGLFSQSFIHRYCSALPPTQALAGTADAQILLRGSGVVRSVFARGCGRRESFAEIFQRASGPTLLAEGCGVEGVILRTTPSISTSPPLKKRAGKQKREPRGNHENGEHLER